MSRFLGKSLHVDFRAQTGFSEEELTAYGLHLIHKSREAANESDHHRYLVGSASLSIINGREIIDSNANKIPPFLLAKGFTSHSKLGDGNPTVHGEFPLLYQAPAAKHLFLGCNTAFCANCLKAAVMRGTDALFVDADSTKEWMEDFKDLWENLCLPIAEHAKIPIYSVDTHKGKIETLVAGVPTARRPLPSNPARILKRHEVADLQNDPDLFLSAARGIRAAIGVARNKKTGEEHFIYAEDSYPPGFDAFEARQMTERYKDAHYHFPLDPIIHMAMMASRHNLELEDDKKGKLFANFVPSGDRQLDLAHIGLKHILFSDKHIPTTAEAKSVMRTLTEADAISYHFVRQNSAISTLIENSFKGIANQPVAGND